MNNKSAFSTVALLICVAFLAACSSDAPAPNGERTILCTTFPIYQIVRNVTQGREGVDVQLMLPSQLGCPHDYALTPRDMQKLAGADILVINGLGLEEFLGAPVEKANPELKIIDSSAGIRNLLDYVDEHNDGEDGHDHGRVNPHLFVSPRKVGELAMNIAAELAKIDPEGLETYAENAADYAEKMGKLSVEFAALGQRLRNNRIVQPHGVYDYLARAAGLEIVAVMQPHGQAASAAERIEIVKLIREKKVGAIFIEPQYPEEVGKALAKEAGIPFAVLDPVASGPEDAPIDYYETVMRKNMATLKATLGVK